jgi:hypothetical protein
MDDVVVELTCVCHERWAAVARNAQVLRGQVCDKWWFAGTSDPDNPYYGYWDRVTDQRPVRFLGLSSIGVTILDYTAYKVPSIPGLSVAFPYSHHHTIRRLVPYTIRAGSTCRRTASPSALRRRSWP